MTKPTAFDEFPVGPEPVTERTARGAARWLKVLNDKGIVPPIDETHAAMFEPPLTVAEQRHSMHIRQSTPADGCRFCQDDAVTRVPTEGDSE